mgnify:CR=1 FL=1
MFKHQNYRSLAGFLAGFYRWSKFGDSPAISEQFLFGHREILLRILDFPQNVVLLGRLQHGWGIDLKSFSDIHLTSFHKGRPIPYLVWNEYDAQFLKSCNVGSVISVGAPWLYLLEHQDKFPELDCTSKEKEGVLFFPSHSFHDLPAIPQSIHTFKHIREVFASERITTVLYWLDFVDPKIKAHYDDLSDSVVCMGYRGAPWNLAYGSIEGGRINFLIELVKKIRQHKYVVLDHIGTALWYSLSLRKDVLLTRNLNISSSYLERALSEQSNVSSDFKPRSLYLQELINMKGQVIYGSENYFYANQELGYDKVKSGQGERILRQLRTQRI